MMKLPVISMVAMVLVLAPVATAGVSHLELKRTLESMQTSLSTLTDRFQRHESRGRQVGVITTKSLQTLLRSRIGQGKNIDNVAVYMAGMSDRLTRIEESIRQQDERERIQLQKILDTMETMEELFQTRFGQLDDVITTSQRTATRVESIDTTLTALNISLSTRLDDMETQSLVSKQRMENTLETHGEKLDGLVTMMSGRDGVALLERFGNNASRLETRWRKNIQDSEIILSQFSVGVGVLVDKVNRMSNESAQVVGNVEEMGKTLTGLKELIEAREDLGGQYSRFDVDEAAAPSGGGNCGNLRRELHRVDHNISTNLEKWITDLTIAGQERSAATDRLITETDQHLSDGQDRVSRMVEDSISMAEQLFERVNEGYTSLSDEIQGLSHLENVMVNTADSVLDTKRRIEYGVQQILLEVGDMMRLQGIHLNESFLARFQGLSDSIVTNQTVGLRNLTRKLEDEIGQVWRQIGVMYQGLSQSADVLEGLESLTASFVNGSLNQADKVDGTISLVSDRMGDVEENLNYLLGRLSLVVSEFNVMKSGIGDELNNLRRKFSTVDFTGDETDDDGIREYKVSTEVP